MAQGLLASHITEAGLAQTEPGGQGNQVAAILIRVGDSTAEGDFLVETSLLKSN